MKKLFVLAICVIGLSACLPMATSQPTPSPANQTEQSMQNPDMTKPAVDQASPIPNQGRYIEYSENAFSAAVDRGDRVVYFFHAQWCPTCKQANQDFTDNLSQIPSGITVLKTDYDTETELKKKYGITYQHTYVLVDAQGNQLKKWNGGAVDQLRTELQ